MLRVLVDNWWLLLLRGIFALGFAVFVFSVQAVRVIGLLQAMALVSVVEMFGLFAFCTGIITIIAAIRGFIRESGWWLLLVDGLGACAVGVVAVTFRDLTFIHLVRLIACWAIFVAAFELLIARKLRRHLPDEWFLAVAAVGAAAFGAYLLILPSDRVRTLFLWLGAYALFSAITMLGLSLRLRKLRNQAHLAAMHAGNQ